MKVGLLNSTDSTGSGIACLRLLEALEQKEHLEPHLLVQKGKNPGRDNLTVLKKHRFHKISYLLRTLIGNYLIKKYSENVRHFSTGLYGMSSIASKLKNKDIIHLHWINDSFISLDGLNQIGHLNKLVFWTLRDLWPITGGCHANEGCQHFTTYCHQCPKLGSDDEYDLSYRIWARKQQVYSNLNPVFIAPSEWMAQQVKKSTLGGPYPVHVIPNPINHERFKPRSKTEGRRYFNLPEDKTYLLFGAINSTNDPIKGFKELMEALSILDQRINLEAANVEILVFGNQDQSIESRLSTTCHLLGHIDSEEAIINCYNAANYLIIPSLQDNLPKMVMEALACGVPCIGFNTGGIPEMIDHEKNGFIAEKGDSHELAVQLEKAIVMQEERRYELAENARQKVLDNYTYARISELHINLYQEYLSNFNQR